jgi:hypothetical protein
VAVEIEVELEFSSPYKRTRVFLQDNKTFYGLWDPMDVRIDGNEARVIVKDGEQGQLDLFAHRAYGDRKLWYIIAHANKINFPHEDVVVGMELIIPKPRHVSAALQRKVPGATTGTVQNESRSN